MLIAAVKECISGASMEVFRDQSELYDAAVARIVRDRGDDLWRKVEGAYVLDQLGFRQSSA